MIESPGRLQRIRSSPSSPYSSLHRLPSAAVNSRKSSGDHYRPDSVNSDKLEPSETRIQARLGVGGGFRKCFQRLPEDFRIRFNLTEWFRFSAG